MEASMIWEKFAELEHSLSSTDFESCCLKLKVARVVMLPARVVSWLPVLD